VAWTVLSRRSAFKDQATTEAAPSLAADGIELWGTDTIVPVLTAPNGQTFDGTGALLGYFFAPQLARWVRSPRADESMADVSGMNEASFPGFPVLTQGGRFAWVCSGVGLSGGTVVRVTLLAVALRDGGGI
jgi:hypothetical protein